MDFTLFHTKIKMKHILTTILLMLVIATCCSQPKGYWRETKSAIPSNTIIYIIDSSLTIAVDTGRFFSTSSDGGDSWSTLSGFRLRKQTSLFPLNKSLFYQIDSQAIYRSTNGGFSWQKLFTIPDAPGIQSGLKMWNPLDGFLLYEDSAKHFHDMITHDGGLSFTDFGHDSIFRSISTVGNFRVQWLDTLNGLVYFSLGSAPSNKVLVTRNGSKDWHITNVFSPSGDTNVFLSANYSGGFEDTYSLFNINAKPYFYFSSDFGEHWATSDTASITTNIAFPSQSGKNTLWASARQTKTDFSPAPRNLLLYSDDLGKNWKPDYLSFKNYDIGFIRFTDSLHGYARGFRIGQAGILSFKFIAGSGSVRENDKPSDPSALRIYPNPCIDVLRVESNAQMYALRIIDILGRCQESFIGQNKSVDTSLLPEGLYTLEFIVNDGSRVRVSFRKITP